MTDAFLTRGDLDVIPIGTVPEATTAAASVAVESSLPISTRVTPPMPLDEPLSDGSPSLRTLAHDPATDTYDPEQLLVVPARATEAEYAVGVTTAPFRYRGGEAFGVAAVGANAALVSAADFGPPDAERTRDRVGTETLKMVATTLGVRRCSTANCAVRGADTVAELDRLDPATCDDCTDRIGAALDLVRA
ncbi:hypothetical protein BRD17_02500 [Halobacteriales archaeon SW_7_68_16]|nr:MAG: hypothetical protein BRD17_02500 [Halobacteriales archaeon SW_7_68_16]